MSLAIDIDKVSAVCIGGEWELVADASFFLDSYEFVWNRGGERRDRMVHGGGASGICSTGFGFKTKGGSWIYGPLSAIQAVTTKELV
jgi:hypothetical protein